MNLAAVLALAVTWAAHDGDTLYTGRSCRSSDTCIRLAAVDCPEIGQPYGREARDLARQLLVSGAAYTARGRERSHGRIVATMRLRDGRDLGMALISAGACWAEPRYRPPVEYVLAQQHARAAKLGLWRADAPVAPWEWRKRGRK